MTRATTIRARLTWLVFLLVVLPVAVAETDDSPACHSEPLRKLEFPAPPLMDGIGQSLLEAETEVADARAYFDQGVRMLHAFWDFEAYRAFKRATELDPKMPMAWWGLHYSTRNSTELEGENEAAWEKIQELRESANDHEAYYLRLAEHIEQKEGEERRKAMISEWEALVDEFPGDVDAKLFLALALMSGYDEDQRPRPNQLYSQALLREVLRTHPEHAGVHHYWIHSIENSRRPEEGLESADKLASLAPKAGHLVHMPGHIYYKIGDYERAYAAFSAGREVDRAYLAEHAVEPVDHWNYVHNVNYLVAACAESGRYAEGLELAREVIGIGLDAERKASNGTMTIFYQGWASLVKLHVRFGNWAAAGGALEEIAAKETLFESPHAVNWFTTYRAYVDARTAIERDDAERARALADRFDALQWRFQKDSESGEMPKDREEDPLYAPWTGRQFEVFSLELRGLIAQLDGDYLRAVELLDRAVDDERKLGGGDPPAVARSVAETLAGVHVEAREWVAAWEAYEKLLERRPGSGHALYGLARVHALAGDDELAGEAYSRFLDAWRHADAELPQVVEARGWLEERPQAVAAAP